MPCRFGAYEVLGRIATSRTCQTFVALHVGADEFRRVVCLQTLNPELAEDDRVKGAFAHSAKLAAKLNHPTCVGVEAFGQERGIYYLAMEYVAGETWENVLARAAKKPELLREEIVAHVIADLCEGLHHAHELRGPEGSYNIVHRGIASNNLVIDDEGRPKLIDFATGKSDLSQDNTETGVIKGSFRYMSPEQILGAVPDRRADIYALGEILFESLTGSTGATLRLEELATSKLEAHPRLHDFRPNVDRELDKIVGRALEVDPRHRFQSCAEMHAALTTYLDSSTAKPRALLNKMMAELFGKEIARRKQIMSKLAFGRTDDPDLLATLRAEPVSERDILEGPKGRFDEASFLAHIRAGEMDRIAPLEKQKAPSLGEAKLKLRAPKVVQQGPAPELTGQTPTPKPKPKPAEPPTETELEMEIEYEGDGDAAGDPEPTGWFLPSDWDPP